MLEDYFSSTRRVAQLREETAGPYLDDFTDWLNNKRYERLTVRVYVRFAARFVIWIRQGGISVKSISQAHLNTYKEYLKAKGLWKNTKNGCNHYTAARHFLKFLQDSDIAPKREKPRENPLLEEFRQWIQCHRGLVESTVNRYTRHVSDLIRIIGAKPRKYSAELLRGFVFDKASSYGSGSAEEIVTSIRSFIRFLIATGQCPSSLEHVIPSVAGWRLSSLPRYMDTADLEKVIKSCDSSTHIGSRDYAVILLLARLGLRAGDVARLQCKDLQWTTALIRLTGKNRRESRLPLPQDVGDAILHYLDTYRPTSSSDNVFLMVRAPYDPIVSHVVSQIARRAIRRAGIDPPSSGAHVFRHSAATAMLRKGVPLQAIGKILRHDSLDTTAYYAKVDISMLKKLALPWPERR